MRWTITKVFYGKKKVISISNLFELFQPPPPLLSVDSFNGWRGHEFNFILNTAPAQIYGWIAINIKRRRHQSDARNAAIRSTLSGTWSFSFMAYIVGKILLVIVFILYSDWSKQNSRWAANKKTLKLWTVFCIKQHSVNKIIFIETRDKSSETIIQIKRWNVEFQIWAIVIWLPPS